MRLQTEQATKVTIQFLVEALVSQVELIVEDVLRHEVASLTVLFRHLTEQYFLFRSNMYAKFYRFG